MVLTGFQVLLNCVIELCTSSCKRSFTGIRRRALRPRPASRRICPRNGALPSRHRRLAERRSRRGHSRLCLEVRGKSHGQGTDVRFIAAGCERSLGVLCHPPAPQPANGFRFDSRSGLRLSRLASCGLVRRRGTRRGTPCRSAWDSSFQDSVRWERGTVVDQFTADLVENLGRVFPGLWKPAKTGRINPVLGGGLNVTIGQRSKELSTTSIS